MEVLICFIYTDSSTLTSAPPSSSPMPTGYNAAETSWRDLDRCVDGLTIGAPLHDELFPGQVPAYGREREQLY